MGKALPCCSAKQEAAMPLDTERAHGAAEGIWACLLTCFMQCGRKKYLYHPVTFSGALAFLWNKISLLSLLRTDKSDTPSCPPLGAAAALCSPTPLPFPLGLFISCFICPVA